MGRNLSAPLANIMNTGSKWSGGDYHTTYWPMASFLSSKKYHFELHMPTYSGDLGFLKRSKRDSHNVQLALMSIGFEFEEMNFAPEGVSSRHEIYWHHNLKEGLEECDECQVVFTQGNTFKKVLKMVQSGQPGPLQTIPDWVHDGAIIGVQGGTAPMNDTRQKVSFRQYTLTFMRSFCTLNDLGATLP